MFTIVRSGTLELAAAVPARQASAVRTGQVVHFIADGRRFDGKAARTRGRLSLEAAAAHAGGFAGGARG